MKWSGHRIVKAVMFGILTTAIIAIWRAGSGSGVDPFADLALRSLGYSIGWYLADLLLVRFLPRQRAVRHRPIIVWALGMGVFMSLFFASLGLLNGSDWTMSQWGMALLSGGLLGTVLGALVAGLSNVAYVRDRRTV